MEEKSHHDHTSDELMTLSYESLKEITDNFAEEHKLGSGTFGEVYKVFVVQTKDLQLFKSSLNTR
jgi:hypothetical protein